jgi:hypothetical protein
VSKRGIIHMHIVNRIRMFQNTRRPLEMRFMTKLGQELILQMSDIIYPENLICRLFSKNVEVQYIQNFCQFLIGVDHGFFL